MIGNDIVDLQLAKKESDWKRPRFLQKLFTPIERNFIERSPHKDKVIWLLWSRKESVYKIVVRMQKRRFYAPKQFENCTFDADIEGQVTYKGMTFSTTSEATDTHIHTVAQLATNQQPLITNCFILAHSTYSSQHTITRQKLMKEYATRSTLSIQELSIQKDEWKVPHLYHKNQRQVDLISIAHHGSFGGYALQKKPQ